MWFYLLVAVRHLLLNPRTAFKIPFTPQTVRKELIATFTVRVTDPTLTRLCPPVTFRVVIWGQCQWGYCLTRGRRFVFVNSLTWHGLYWWIGPSAWFLTRWRSMLILKTGGPFSLPLLTCRWGHRPVRWVLVVRKP